MLVAWPRRSRVAGHDNGIVISVVATDTLKQQQTKVPFLASFDPSLPTQVHVEASHTVLEAVLTQVRSDITQVVEYASYEGHQERQPLTVYAT